MIKVVVKQTNSQVVSINISGHAEYDVHGRDIVCAAVSTASIVTANAIEVLGYKKDVQTIINDEGYLDIKVINSNETIEKLLRNLLSSLEDLEKQYTKNIKILK